MNSNSINDKNKPHTEPKMNSTDNLIQLTWDELYQNLISDIIAAYDKMAILDVLMEMGDADYRKTLENEKLELLAKMKERDDLFYKRAYQHFSMFF